MPASLDDLLTAIKNLVQATNAQTQNDMVLAGLQDFWNLSSTAVVKASSGRLVRISVILAGSTYGYAYDQAPSDTVGASRPIFAIPNTVGLYDVNLPVQYGIIIVPGTGMAVSGSFS